MVLHYTAVESEIRNLIAQEGLKKGDRIPPERELSKRLGISRMTVRRAIEHLVDIGILRRDATRGTIVAGPKIVRKLNSLSPPSRIMELRGLRPSTRLIEFEQVRATENLARDLRLTPGEPVVYMKRLRSADEEPFSIERMWVPSVLVPDLRKDDAESRSFFERLESRYNIKLARAEETLELTLASKEDASLLGVRIRAPLFLICSVTYDVHGVPVEYSEQMIRSDSCRFQYVSISEEGSKAE